MTDELQRRADEIYEQQSREDAIDRESAARAAARVAMVGDSFDVEDDARVTFLDEDGTGLKGWAWVDVRVLIAREEIERETARAAVQSASKGGER